MNIKYTNIITKEGCFIYDTKKEAEANCCDNEDTYAIIDPVNLMEAIRYRSNQIQKAVKPAYGKCIDCKFYLEINYKKDIRNVCRNENVVFGEILMEADKFGCIYFESKK